MCTVAPIGPRRVTSEMSSYLHIDRCDRGVCPEGFRNVSSSVGSNLVALLFVD